MNNPIISNCERTGYPDGDPVWPHCPVCGEIAETFFRNHQSKEILGCDNCMGEFDAWDEDDQSLFY